MIFITTKASTLTDLIGTSLSLDESAMVAMFVFGGLDICLNTPSDGYEALGSDDGERVGG